MRIPILILALCVVGLSAQESKPIPYTEIESLRLQNVSLEGQAIEEAKRTVAERETRWREHALMLKKDLEAARPGWTFSLETGQWAAPVAKKESK
jgi:hypothetical protein